MAFILLKELESRANNALVVGIVEAVRPFGLLIQIRKVSDLDGILERGVLASNLVSIQ